MLTRKGTGRLNVSFENRCLTLPLGFRTSEVDTCRHDYPVLTRSNCKRAFPVPYLVASSPYAEEVPPWRDQRSRRCRHRKEVLYPSANGSTWVHTADRSWLPGRYQAAVLPGGRLRLTLRVPSGASAVSTCRGRRLPVPDQIALPQAVP